MTDKTPNFAQKLDDYADQLDDDIQAKLAQARQRAVNQNQWQRLKSSPLAWATGGFSVTAAAVLVAVLWVQAPELSDEQLIDDIIAMDADPEMLQELEFFLWLAEQEDFTG